MFSSAHMCHLKIALLLHEVIYCCCKMRIIHSYTVHCTALTMKARTLQIPRPLKKTPAPSVWYACLAICKAPMCVLRPSAWSNVCCSLLRTGSGWSTCVCTLVLITSSGKIVAHVTIPASPPHINTLNAVSLFVSSGELHACLHHSYDQKLHLSANAPTLCTEFLTRSHILLHRAHLLSHPRSIAPSPHLSSISAAQ